MKKFLMTLMFAVAVSSAVYVADNSAAKAKDAKETKVVKCTKCTEKKKCAECTAKDAKAKREAAAKAKIMDLSFMLQMMSQQNEGQLPVM